MNGRVCSTFQISAYFALFKKNNFSWYKNTLTESGNWDWWIFEKRKIIFFVLKSEVRNVKILCDIFKRRKCCMCNLVCQHLIDHGFWFDYCVSTTWSILDIRTDSQQDKVRCFISFSSSYLFQCIAPRYIFTKSCVRNLINYKVGLVTYFSISFDWKYVSSPYNVGEVMSGKYIHSISVLGISSLNEILESTERRRKK